MLTEIGRKEILEQEIDVYIQENYPADPLRVKEVVEKIEKQQKSFPIGRELTAQSWLNATFYLASEEGIFLNVGNYPRERHVPTALAALKEYEKGTSPEKRYLNRTEYCRILAMAEFVTAKRGIFNLNGTVQPEVLAHTQRAIDLIGFINKLAAK